jgi:uncharacterized protein
MTAESLKTRSLKDLAQMAKKRGVPGWHAMKKEQLVRALTRVINRANAKRTAPSTTAATKVTRTLAASAPSSKHSGGNGAVHRNGVARPAAVRTKKVTRDEKQLEQIRTRTDRMKNLATVRPDAPDGPARDRLVAMVRDPYWLHAYWELTRQGVRRAEAALGQEWHMARPVLRLLEVSSSGTTSSSAKVLRDIDIHGNVSNWYVDVQDPPHSFRLEIGYLTASGRFFVLARSNVVSTPRAGAADSIDENWTDVAENFDKIYAMSGGYSANGSAGELQQLFEERLRRPMGTPMMTRFGAGANGNGKRKDFDFELDAELIVYGSTEPGSHVTLQGDPVKLRPDGTFTVRFSLPNCRQVIPAVACSADGVEQRTVILAVERNTKTMEPVVRDNNE